MGILHGRDIFNPKWITALISDSGNRLWLIPVKFTIGTWFICQINRSLYVFELDHRAIRTYHATGVRALRFIFFDVSHCQPLQPDQLDKLRRYLENNKLGKVNRPKLNLFRILKSKEAGQQSHDLGSRLEDLQQHTETETEAISEVIGLLQGMNKKQIAAPIEPISSFLDEELLATKPSFLGNLFSMHESLAEVRQKVTNRPASGKISWLKLGLVAMVIMGIAVFLFIGTEEGWFDFDSLDLGIGGELIPSNDPNTPEYWTSKYTAEELALAVESGEVNRDDIPKEVWDIIKNQDV